MLAQALLGLGRPTTVGALVCVVCTACNMACITADVGSRLRVHEATKATRAGCYFNFDEGVVTQRACGASAR